MSGLEAVGIAASIVQIAEIGTQLAVKLCAFYHKIKTADQRIQNLSNNVALTSSVLKLLGDNLRQDEQAKLYSKQAFGTTQDVLDECKSVFEQIRDAIDQSPSKNLFHRAAKKLSFVAMEDELELLGRNLERLKSTLHLMLNVIMYAGQLRSRTEPTALKDQRDLIQSLLDHKRMTERRFEEMTRALEGAKLNDDQPRGLQPEHLISAATLPTTSVDNPLADLSKYYLLVKKLLEDVDSYRSDIEQYQHRRVRNGILRIHNAEIQHMEVTHGPQMAQMFRNRIYELSDSSTEIEQNIFGSAPTAGAQRPRSPSTVIVEVKNDSRHRKIPSQDKLRQIRSDSLEAKERVDKNRSSSMKPPYQEAPVPQSPAPVQNPPPPFLDTIRTVSRLSPAQLIQLDRLAEIIRGRLEKPALERIEARLHMLNAGEYDGDIVQLFFRRQALEQLQKRRSQMRTDVDPRNRTDPISVHPNAPPDVNLNGPRPRPAAQATIPESGRPIVAGHRHSYGSQDPNPLEPSHLSSRCRRQQRCDSSEYLSTPPFVLDSQELSPSGVPHRRSRSDAYPSQITIGVSSEACGYAPAAGLRVESIYRSRGSPSPEREHRRGRANRRRPPRESNPSPSSSEASDSDDSFAVQPIIRHDRRGRTNRTRPPTQSIPSAPGSEASDSDDSSVGQPIIRLERREGFGDDLNTAPSSSSSETAYDTLQGEDVPTQDLHKSAPDEIDSLVLQWTNVGGDEMARASRV